jgi:cyclic-di-AMP phosphodiesterase PgpH
MASGNKKTLILILLTLVFVILFFNSIFILPAFYAEVLTTKTLTILLFVTSFFSALVIFTLLVYVLPHLNKEIALNKRFTRLESLNHPLLLKLSTEAPGSYHHSVNVANLSHRAAKSIGVNAALVRIAGYYHDIGKIIHPEIYIENQGIKISKNKTLGQIIKAAKIITNHTLIGKKIAEDYSLPDEIVQIISEHHGTTSTKFLYDQAKELGSPNSKYFRYSGPKPQTVESLIVMLADCIEAAAKGARELDRNSIANLVDNSIKEKINEKQFSNVNFSSSGYQKIRNSFVKTLSSMYHQRITSQEINEN